MADPARPRHRGRSFAALTALTAALVATLTASPPVEARFESICGDGPSGSNDCPWYHVEVVIFANDGALSGTPERLAGEVEPRWPPRLATLLPPEGEPLRPTRTAELLAIWQSAGQAPSGARVTPGLTLEQERFLAAMAGIGRPRHPIDYGYLRTMHHPGALDPVATDDVVADDAAADALLPPALEPIVVIARPYPEISPELALVDPQAEAEARPIPMDLAFREIPPGGRLLEREAGRLQRNRDYRVLAHLAWRQPFAPNEAGLAQLVYVEDPRGDAPGQGDLLLGTLTLELRRFLHAHLDLYFRGADAVEEDGKWIRVRQSRRMRSGELHYLDHPRIGALIRIERFTLDPDD